MARQENWEKVFWQFNWAFCAPEGRYYYIRYSLYSYANGVVYQSGGSKACWNAGDGGNNECYYDGMEEKVAVVAKAWSISQTDSNDIVYAGFALSGDFYASITGLCDTNPY